jgi:hypothetical protein
VELSEADERAILALRERLHGRKLWSNPPYPADEASDLAILYAIRDEAVDRAWHGSEGIPEDIEALCDARDEVKAMLEPDDRQWYLARWAALLGEDERRDGRLAHLPPPTPANRSAISRAVEADFYVPIRRTAEEFARRLGARVYQVSFSFDRDDSQTDLISVNFRWHLPGDGPLVPPGSCTVKVPCRLDRPSEIREHFRPAEEAIPADALPDWPSTYLSAATWSFETP